MVTFYFKLLITADESCAASDLKFNIEEVHSKVSLSPSVLSSFDWNPLSRLCFESGALYYHKKAYWSANNSFNHCNHLLCESFCLPHWSFHTLLLQNNHSLVFIVQPWTMLWVWKPQVIIFPISKIHLFLFLSMWAIEFSIILPLFCSRG